MKQHRQGDVWLEKVARLPENRKLVSKGTRAVLAEGETTGHAHVLESERVELFLDKDGEMFLETLPGLFVHEDHVPPQTVEPGIYKVIRQQTYTPGEIQKVRD
jgi:hypothetical protein